MTTKTIEKILVLHGQGLNDRQIAEQIGASTSTAEYWRKKMGLKANRSYESVKHYTIYDENDNLRVHGSAKECAAALGIRIDSIYHAAYIAGRKGNGRVVVCGNKSANRSL